MRGSAIYHSRPITVPIRNSKFPIHGFLVATVVFVATAASNSAADLGATPPHTQQAQTQRATTNKPHVPPWSVSRPPVPSQTPEITPGGTFSRPQSTFSPQTGSFSRPQSTFSHPGSPYTPRPPIQLPPERPDRPHRPRPIQLYPQTVIVHNPVVYEPYYIPVETPAAVEAAPAPTQPAIAEPPVVIDLPPGATIRKPSTPAPAAPPAAQTAAPPAKTEVQP